MAKKKKQTPEVVMKIRLREQNCQKAAMGKEAKIRENLENGHKGLPFQFKIPLFVDPT